MVNRCINSKSFIILLTLTNFLTVTLESINLNAVRKFKKKYNGISIFYKSPHQGLTSSVIRGLSKLEIPYNINPNDKKDIKEVFLCLQDASLLRMGIKLKEKNLIKKLIVGPNMFARAYEENHLLANKNIDKYLVPSEWTRIACTQDEPAVKDTIKVWPAGVDSEYWKPEPKKETFQVLIYWKTESQEFCDQVKNILLNYGWQPIVIKYDHYNHEHYKKLLNKVKFAVFLSKSESQGLALAECWSMNIPTLVWDPKELFYLGKHYDPVTSCPFLTEQTGKSWKKLSELEELLTTMKSYWPEFNPREWVLDNMTDEVSASLLLEIIYSKKNKTIHEDIENNETISS